MLHTTEQYRPRVTRAFNGDEGLRRIQQRLESILTVAPNKHFCPGDDAATTYCSVGIVLMAAAMSGSRDDAELAAMTGFHLEFPHAVLEIMDQFELWGTDWYLNLCGKFTRHDSGIHDIVASLEYAMECLWWDAWSLNHAYWLEVCRARIVFGGVLQNYIDLEFREEFLF